jgi:hypothetical protein
LSKKTPTIEYVHMYISARVRSVDHSRARGTSAAGSRPLQVSLGGAAVPVHRERGRCRGQSPRRSPARACTIRRDARRGHGRRQQLHVRPYGPVARAGRPPRYCCASRQRMWNRGI